MCSYSGESEVLGLRAMSTDDCRSALLAGVRLAIRLGCYDEATSALSAVAGNISRDAERLNLLGILCEARQDWASARRCYRKAVWAGGSCAAARQNIRRLYELDTFGRSALHVALGDERPALAALLRTPVSSDMERPKDTEE